jgi:hypothetical protein
MDQQKLRALVFEKTGVKIDIDDPIFALVALNEAVLAEAVERHVALLDDATADLADQADALIQAGSVCRYPAGAPERPLAALVKADPGPAASFTAQERRMAAIAGGAALLCALLVLAGQALLFKPPVIAPSTVMAQELSAAQAQAIRDGEKLEKIVQQLDPKTRNAILAEMQKP